MTRHLRNQPHRHRRAFQLSGRSKRHSMWGSSRELRGQMCQPRGGWMITNACVTATCRWPHVWYALTSVGAVIFRWGLGCA